MPIVQATIENAIQAWIIAGSGYPGARVRIADQGGPQLALDFISFRLSALGDVGQAARKVTYDAGQANGQELNYQWLRQKTFTVTLQAFDTATAGAGSGFDVLNKVRNALDLASVTDALLAAGIVVFDRGQVQNVTAVREAYFEGRGILEVRCRLQDDISEKLGYIVTVAGPTGVYTGGGVPPPRPYALGFASGHTNGVAPNFQTSFVVPTTLELWVAIIVNATLAAGNHTAFIEWDLPGGTAWFTWNWTFNMQTNPDGNRVWVPAPQDLEGTAIEQFGLYGVHSFQLYIDGQPKVDPLAPLPGLLTLTGS